MSYEELLMSKGFALDTSGNYWELVVHEDGLKTRICEIFDIDAEFDEYGVDVEVVILQCKSDFTGCIVVCDYEDYDVDTEEFMKCIEQL